jgi:hypothetical protein
MSGQISQFEASLNSQSNIPHSIFGPRPSQIAALQPQNKRVYVKIRNEEFVLNVPVHNPT